MNKTRVVASSADQCRAKLSASLSKCYTINEGFVCQPNISHYWGQYSPYYRVPSEISSAVPKHCNLTFAQVLSRHGARDPTLAKTTAYGILVRNLKNNVHKFGGKYSFLKDYEYKLGADQLSFLGQQHLVYSGINFYQRYRHLSRAQTPFVRASGQKRVVDSAVNWTQGFHQAFLGDKHHGKDTFPYAIEIIPEISGTNNSLSHDLCTAFQSGPASKIGRNAQLTWMDVFVPPIQSRLNTDLPGANFSKVDVVNFMDLCPFETVATPKGTLSQFCTLFTKTEWHQFDYYQSLGKYYGFGPGNPLGSTQGVGWVNELIARMTHSPVDDKTSVNHTLDDDSTRFPVDANHNIFADFSHDNDMTGIMGALGLYNLTTQPPLDTMISQELMDGYSASWTVPFAARMYVEKMQCTGEDEELVRILINDRVIPLAACGGAKSGSCKLSDFLTSLAFARNGGYWDQCFIA